VSEPLLEGRDLLVSYAGSVVLDVPSVAVQEGEVLALIGPNGAGKSTLLRVLGLLEHPSRGSVRFRGSRVPSKGGDLLALRRRFASVFQEPLLCDGTVEDNAALGLRFRKRSSREIAATVPGWLERLGIAHLAGRHVRALSGGEAQRVSLARAFAIRPEVLLLDEPFTALDAPSRDELLDLLLRLLREERCTTLWVTHDREEALRAGDRIGVVIEGRLMQVAPPAEVFGRPGYEAVARFVGIETILSGRVIKDEEDLLTVAADGVTVEALGRARVGDHVLVCLRPEDVTVRRRDEPVSPDSARNRLPGIVKEATPLGPQYRVHLDCGPMIVALVTKQSQERLRLTPGTPVLATFKASAAHLIPH
jgi:tungstate transport system ATP-binding protein